MSTSPGITPPEERERYIRESHRQTGLAFLGTPRFLYVWGLVVLAGCILALAEFPSHLVHEYQEWEGAGHPGLPDLSIALSMGILAASLIAMPLAGVLTDWIGVRRTILAVLSLGGSGLVFFGLSECIWTLYPAYLLTGLGLGGWLPVMVGVCRRFRHRRALAIALANTVGEFGKSVVYIAFIALFTWSISPHDGWISWNRLTVSMGLAFVAVALAGYAVLTFRRRDTAPMSGSGRLDDDTTAEPPVAPEVADFTARQALGSRAFRFIAAGNAIATMTAASAVFYLALMLTDRGHSIESAAWVIGFYSLIFFSSILVGGFVGNRYSLPRGLAAFVAIQVVGLTLLAFADGLALTFPAVALVAIGAGGRLPLSVAILADYFGTSSLGKILGWSEMLAILAATGGISLFGWALDWRLGYTVIMLILAGLSLVAVLCFLRVQQPSAPDVEPAPLWAPLS